MKEREIVELQVSEEAAKVRIDKFLSDEFSDISRSYIQKLIKDGNVKVNDKPVKANYKTVTADKIEFEMPEPEELDIVAEDIPLDILYEDEDILVINKPADMPVHPSIGNYTNTLANGVAAYLDAKDEHSPFRCINRLDRDTSGALILAKNAFSAAVLSTQMRNRQIRRTYLAVVEGITPPNGTISAPISRVDDSVIERHVDFLRGEPAVTHYERLEVKNEHSLLEIHLETGRTHQIRVHMGYIGHPLPADYLYHPVYDCFKRQPLHSLQLEFRHPVTDKSMCLLAPVSEDMCNAF